MSYYNRLLFTLLFFITSSFLFGQNLPKLTINSNATTYEVAPGESFPITIDIGNYGTAIADAGYDVKVQLFLSNSANSIVELANYSFAADEANLAINQRRSLPRTITIPATTPNGNFQMNLSIVYNETQQFGGNVAIKRLEVSGETDLSAIPDLQLSDLRPFDSPFDTDLIQYTLTVANIGNQFIANTRGQIFLSTDTNLDATDVEVGTLFISELSPNNSYSPIFTIDLPPNTCGNFTLFFVANSITNLPESDLENNTIAATYNFTDGCSNSDCTGDIVLSTQAEVDAFPICDVYSGNILIQGDDITQVDALINLRKVNGKLEFNTLPNLQNINGLANLEEAEFLTFANSPQLADINPLSNLRRVEKNIAFAGARALSNLDGLTNLEFVENITILGSDLLKNIDGLRNAQGIRVININNVPQLLNIEGFHQVDILERIIITAAPVLESLQGLRNLAVVNDQIDFFNTGINNLNGLENLQRASRVSIGSNNNLNDITALSNLTVNQLTIINNSMLSECCSIFDQVSDNANEVTIRDNAVGCSSVTEITNNCQSNGCFYEFSNLNFPTQISPNQQITITATVTNITDQVLATRPINLVQSRGGIEFFPTPARIGEGATIPVLAPNESASIQLNIQLPQELYISRTLFGPTVNDEFYLQVTEQQFVLDDYGICNPPIDWEVVYPDADIAINLINDEGCYGDDLILNADIEIINNGSMAINTPVYFALFPSRVDFNRDNFSDRFGFTFARFIGASGFFIKPPFLPGERLVIDNPLQSRCLECADIPYSVSLDGGSSLIEDISPNDNTLEPTFRYDPNCGEPTSNGFDLALDLTTSTTNLNQYQSAPFALTLTNEGNQTATNIEVDFSNENIVLTNGKQPILSSGTFNFFGDQIWRIPNLAAGTTVTLEVDFFFLAEPFLYAEIIAAQGGTDSDSTPNNGDGQTASEDDETVFPTAPVERLPDLTIDNLRLPSLGGQAGTVFDYLVNINNIGNVNVTGDYTLGAYISTDPVFSADDIEAGIIPTGNTPLGTISDVPGSITIPVDLAVGEYYLIAVIDRDNDIREGNENNNTTFSVRFQVTAAGNANCQIIVTVFDKACTPNDNPAQPEDATFDLVLRATATAGSATYRINGSDETYTYGANVPILGLPISVTNNILITDSENPACRTEIDVIPPPDCPEQMGGQLDNLNLTIQHPATFQQYEGVKIIYEVNNAGDATIRDIKVNIPLPTGTANTDFTVDEGAFNFFTEAWTIPNLAAGETARLTWNVFALAEREIRGRAQIMGQEASQSFTITRTNFRLSAPQFNLSDPIAQVVVYPTLVQDRLQIGIVATQSERTKLQMFNVQGQLIQEQSISLERGQQTIQLTASDLAAGTYFLRIGEFQLERFVKL